MNDELKALNYAYLKFKVFWFYDKTVFFYKKMISDFEVDGEEKHIKLLYEAILYSKFDLNCNNIELIPIPKVDKIDINNKLSIEDDNNYNFFVKMPIEYFIIDTVFTIFLIDFYKLNLYSNESYANKIGYLKRLNKSQLTSEEELFFSNDLFSPYSIDYSDWVNDFNSFIYKAYQHARDIYFIGKIDFVQFYYNLSYDFDDLFEGLIDNYSSTIIRNKNFVKEIIKIEKNILTNISKKLNSVKINCLNNGIFRVSVGLFSSKIISDMLLKNFDTQVKKTIKTAGLNFFYGRYVDDMLFVIKKGDSSSPNPKTFFLNLFNNFFEKSNDDLLIRINDKLKLAIHKDEKKFFMEYIDKRTDFKNLFKRTNFTSQILVEPFLNDFSMKSDFDKSSLNAFRKNLNLYLNYLDVSEKSKKINIEKIKEIRTVESVFKLFPILHYIFIFLRKLNLNKEYKRIFSLAKKSLIKFANYKSKYDSLKNELLIKNIYFEKKKISKIYKFDSEEIFDYFENNLYSIFNYNKLCNTKNIEILKIKILKEYLPIRIATQKLSLFLECFNANNFLPIYKKFLCLLKRLHLIFNGYECNIKLKVDFKSYICKCKSNMTITRYFFDFHRLYPNPKDTIKCAITNLNMDPKMSYKYNNNREIQFFVAAINEAYINKCSIITFPEASIDIKTFFKLLVLLRARRNDLVCGLRVTTNNLNFIATYSYSFNLVLLREKNLYSLDEIENITPEKYSKRKRIFLYFLIDSSFSYTSMLCYEFTSIFERSLLNEFFDFDAMIVIEQNKDTKYFSNIVESYSRDAYTYVIQTNINNFGDSRVRQPTDSFEADLVKLKGGINNFVVCTKLDIKNLRFFKHMDLDTILSKRKLKNNKKKNKDVANFKFPLVK